MISAAGRQLFVLGIALALSLVADTSFSVDQTAEEQWSHFKFSAGQSFKYDLKSERGLKGWVSVSVADGGGDTLDITLAGDWSGEFSEIVTLKPGMSALDFVYSAQDFRIPNAMSSLLIIDDTVIQNVEWKDGFTWSKDDKSLAVSGSREYAGVKGFLLTYTSKHFVTKRMETRVYCVNPGLPLPIFVSVPAANDTWMYELVETK